MYREPEVAMGRHGRTARLKKDAINLHMTIYDENREDSVLTYFSMMEMIGKQLRLELGLVKKDIEDAKGEDSNEDESLLDEVEGLPG